MPKYIFREDPITLKGGRKADPQMIGDTLDSIRMKAGGELKPGRIVEEATAAEHPLHPFFEWDDKVAADGYRLDQARTIVRSIRVEVADEPPMPAFISITGANGVSYRSLGDVQRSSDLQRALLRQADCDLAAWEMRYRALRDVCGLIRPVRAALQSKIAKKVEAERERPAA